MIARWIYKAPGWGELEKAYLLAFSVTPLVLVPFVPRLRALSLHPAGPASVHKLLPFIALSFPWLSAPLVAFRPPTDNLVRITVLATVLQNLHITYSDSCRYPVSLSNHVLVNSSCWARSGACFERSCPSVPSQPGGRRPANIPELVPH